jgi:hypothetical protein
LFDNITIEVSMIQDLRAVFYWLVISMQGLVQLTTMLIVVTLSTTCLTCSHWGMTFRRFCPSDITRTRGVERLAQWILRPLPLLGIVHSHWQDRKRWIKGVHLLCQWRLQRCGLYGRITCSVWLCHITCCT